MTPNERPRRRFVSARAMAVTILAGTAALFGGGRAEAQWGYGGYGIFGGFGNYQAREVTDFYNQRSLIAGQAAYAARGGGGGNNANMYYNHAMDRDYYPKFDTRSRSGVVDLRYGPAPAASTTPAPAPAPAATTMAARPVLPLNRFFNGENTLVWPADSPMSGDLGTKRQASDAACLAVLKQKNAQGYALVATVTEARGKLVDYGQPALQFLRTYSTPRIADTFHLFLLSLYDSLGQAAQPAPRAPAVSAPPAR
jgi:hypothetical protein